MAALVVVEILEAKKLALQVASVPKRYEVEILAPDRADESFHERVRQRHMRHCLHFRYIEYSKIGLPAMESKQRIIVGAEIFR